MEAQISVKIGIGEEIHLDRGSYTKAYIQSPTPDIGDERRTEHQRKDYVVRTVWYLRVPSIFATLLVRTYSHYLCVQPCISFGRVTRVVKKSYVWAGPQGETKRPIMTTALPPSHVRHHHLDLLSTDKHDDGNIICPMRLFPSRSTDR